MPTRAMVLLVSLCLAGSAPADVVWRVADPGPLAPDQPLILGDDARTLAFTATGDWELHGTSWVPAGLRSAEVLGPDLRIRFANGRFVGLRVVERHLDVFVLEGAAWTRVGALPDEDWSGGILAGDRLYWASDGFNSCFGMATSGDCATAPPDSRTLRSLSLVDRSVREEARLPSCFGYFFVVSGKLHLLELRPGCGGPGAPPQVGRLSGRAIPFHRLDESGWVDLPPWSAPTWDLRTTPDSIWSISMQSGRGWVAQIFTPAGLSAPIDLPPELGDPTPLEWNGGFALRSPEARANVWTFDGIEFTRLSPASPVSAPPSGPAVMAAGRSLFTMADGWNPVLFTSSGWVETTGIGGTPGATEYFMGDAKTFAIRGERAFRRDPDGWTRLSVPPGNEWRWGAEVWNDRLVVGVSQPTPRLLAHDDAADEWTDLIAGPTRYLGPMWSAGGDLWVAGPGVALARLHEGGWTFLTPRDPAHPRASISLVREVAGEILVFTKCGCGPPIGSAFEPAYRVEGDELVRAFADLDPSFSVRDAILFEGRVHLLVSGLYGGRVLAAGPNGVYDEVLAHAEMDDLLDWAIGGPLDGLSRAGDALLLAGAAYSRGQLRAQRGASRPTRIDRRGRFAVGDLNAAYAPRFPLLEPAVRVRKSIAAVVDVRGYARYESTLWLANLSATKEAVAHVFAASPANEVLTVTLPAGQQRRVADPVPGYVGPLAVEFEGLDDERDAWAMVVVQSPSGGGTASTSILAADTGSVPYRAVVLPPAPSSGARLHLALANAADGLGGPLAVPDITIPPMGFDQRDPTPEEASAPLVFAPWRPAPFAVYRPADDLLGYLVRNDGITNDGAVIPFEPPDVRAGRRSRFLPVVVRTTSPYAAYRTELTFGWWPGRYPQTQSADFTATWRGSGGAARSFSFTVATGELVAVPDAVAWLASNGIPVDPSSAVGTLTLGSSRPEGAADLLVTAVVLARTPGSAGEYGVNVPVVNEGRWASTIAVVPALREDGGFRSNLALANPEPDGGPILAAAVSLYASDGRFLGSLPLAVIPPGDRVQWDRVMRYVGFSGDGYAVITRAGGAARFVAYGVVNDNVTGDGTLVPMQVPSSPSEPGAENARPRVDPHRRAAKECLRDEFEGRR